MSTPRDWTYDPAWLTDGSFEVGGYFPFEFHDPYIETVKFEGKLVVLAGLIRPISLMNEQVLSDAVHQKNDYMDMVMESAPDCAYESASFADGHLYELEELLPSLTLGGLFALILTALEHFLSELCVAEEARTAEPWDAFRRRTGGAHVDRAQKYLREKADWDWDDDAEAWEMWRLMRKGRNSLMHSLMEDAEPLTLPRFTTDSVLECLTVCARVANVVTSGRPERTSRIPSGIPSDAAESDGVGPDEAPRAQF